MEEETRRYKQIAVDPPWHKQVKTLAKQRSRPLAPVSVGGLTGQLLAISFRHLDELPPVDTLSPTPTDQKGA